MYRTILTGGVAAIALAVASAPAFSQETINLTAATGHPEVFLWVKHIKETFIPTVNAELAKTGKVKINWTEGYGGTIVKLGSEVEAFQQGIIDVGQMSGVFNPATMGLLNLTYAMPFGPPDARGVTAAVEKALMETEGALQKLEEATGVVYIGGGIAIDDYNIASTKALTKIADMNGVKLGGAGPNLAWLAGTGAVGVQGSYVTFYNDIKTGVRRQYRLDDGQCAGQALRGRAQLEPNPFRRDVYRRHGRVEDAMGHVLGRDQGRVPHRRHRLHESLFRRTGSPIRGGQEDPGRRGRQDRRVRRRRAQQLDQGIAEPDGCLGKGSGGARRAGEEGARGLPRQPEGGGLHLRARLPRRMT
ncbi:hypothetical protein LRS09_07950 [Mesorhizobium sp. J428]|nr:hypothetical protein [Mesorhizobium sp. J428]MCR5856699.1 hypothetical protein [Mesorhizobium sp. J428]